MGECIVLSAGTDISDADAAVGDVKDPKTFYSVEEPKKTGTMPTQALDPDNENVPAGYYAATTLSAVDADLAAGNIKSGVTIFGIVGSVSPTEDAIDSDAAGDTGQTYAGGYDAAATYPSGAVVTKSTSTVAVTAGAVVWGFAVFSGTPNSSSDYNKLKGQLYIGGVLKSETAYINATPRHNILRGSASGLSGNQNIELKLKNYNADFVNSFYRAGWFTAGVSVKT